MCRIGGAKTSYSSVTVRIIQLQCTHVHVAVVHFTNTCTCRLRTVSCVLHLVSLRFAPTILHVHKPITQPANGSINMHHLRNNFSND